MPISNKNDLEFLTEAMSHITASLDLETSLVHTFKFMKQHFPIDAISLHQYSSKLQSLKLLFLVSEGRFEFVETTVPLSDEVAVEVVVHDEGITPIRIIPNSRKHAVAKLHCEALASFIPFKDRGYLLGVLRSGDKTVGHLSLMGTHENCFTEEHKRELSLLLTPFSLAMSNLLTHRRTKEFQDRLYEENIELQKGLNLIRDKRIVGDQGGLRGAMDIVYQLQGREVPVLILGETGTGKELIADVIQQISPRAERPFVKVNCGAIPDTLVDSELFGYEKGAFTGATSSRPGRFEQANGGTLFLDEVGELPLQAQVRLLRVLQDNVVERLGSTRSIKVDVRVIAATNRNLERMMQEGTFREDLYYRLYVFPIKVPPLRERIQDIPELVHHFLKRSSTELGIGTPPKLLQKTMQRLFKYSWPGNVRELENLVKRGVILYPDGPLLLEELLPQDGGWYVEPEESQNYLEKRIDARVELALKEQLSTLIKSNQISELLPQTSSSDVSKSAVPLRTLEDATKEAIIAALEAAHGKIKGVGGAAEILAINPNTLRSKMRKLGLTATSL